MDDAGTLLVMMLSSKSILDTVEVIRVFKFLYRYGFQHTEQGIRKMLTLIYHKDKPIVEAVIDCYQSLYFNEDISAQEKVKNLLYLMKDATLTDITCIEELLGKLILNDVFERQVYNLLWTAYIKFGTNFNQINAEMT
jgi:condensin complex subunit 1